MNNKQKGESTPELLAQVKTVLDETEKQHRYSVSRIYAAHNTVFGLNETPESCSSCLRNRAKALRKWYDGLNETTDTVVLVGGKSRTYEEIAARYHLLFGEENGLTEGAAIANLLNINADTESHAALGFEPLSEEDVATLDQRLAEVHPFNPANTANTTSMPLIELKDKDGQDVTAVFEAANGINGFLSLANGKNVKPGTYTDAEGNTYAVQPGGKTTKKVKEEDLL